MTKFGACGDPTTGSATIAEDDALPVQPFTALRAAYGMLLGEDDFLVLMGNPRGKQMVHTSWLHGAGVIWGFDVGRDEGRLRVRPGLAVDRRGRELRLETSQCLDLAAWAKEWLDKNKPKDEHQEWVHAYVMAEFKSCLDHNVPTLADPCDIARQHDSPSRVVETTRLRIVAEPPPAAAGYHRLRVLLGLKKADPKTDKDVLDAIHQVHSARFEDRPAELLRQFRLMAALDATQRRPAGYADDKSVPHFPVDERDSAGILLAKLSVPVKTKSYVRIEPRVRTALLPTAVIQELLSGLAPGLIGDRHHEQDAGGPRLLGVEWIDPVTAELTFDRPIARNSWEDQAISVSSASYRGHGWRREHIDEIGFRGGDEQVVVLRMAGGPAYSLVRVVVRGTGTAPLLGQDPFVPFAGLPGGPPGSVHQGHDAAHNARAGS
ncbi:hypothetical protein Q2K19_22080 [Micromonospora soli]|uniref:hypothetical protein n=1 Tax=Micromonospora sp. NBRC 110009 TaxID=3061627 RepID=UPI002670EF17|nr:hypothetical protein [Micromonospora sp. NBRC 110009]WKT96865.1 hypothetical protein Q2K19_22080 [Micromonospora sp. NBRC 110009]